MRLFKLHDAPPEDFDNKLIEITEQQAVAAQAEGYGIFHLVNEFSGRRILQNLKHINFWFAEVDEKQPIRQLIEAMPMHPSLVNETKNGYHVYFAARDATAGRYKLIQKRIMHALGGDPNARDAARVLRTPGYLHLKDPADPFLVQTIWQAPVSYREAVMLQAWQPHPEELEEAKPAVTEFKPTGDSYLDKLWSLDQGDLLLRFSGHPAVCFEQYTFKRTSKGYNILVNGKGTSCFIDQRGRIGSADGGGPGVLNWLMWFGHSFKESLEIIKETIGEL